MVSHWDGSPHPCQPRYKMPSSLGGVQALRSGGLTWGAGPERARVCGQSSKSGAVGQSGDDREGRDSSVWESITVSHHMKVMQSWERQTNPRMHQERHV